MFNIPFVYRGAGVGGDALPSYGNAQAILWVDASQSIYKDYGITPATMNSNVFQWNDLTVYGNNLSGTTGTSYGTSSGVPVLSAQTFSPSGSSAAFNYIEFNDSQKDYLVRNNNQKINGFTGITSGFTIFWVFKRNVSRIWSSGDPIIQYNDSWFAENSGFGIDGDSSPTVLNLWYANKSVNTTTISIPWGSGGISDTSFFYYTYRMSGGTCTGYVGEKLKAGPTTAIGSNKEMQQPGSQAILSIASSFNSNAYAQSSPIDVAEAIVYNGALTDSQLTAVWGYLRQKYGFIS